MAQLGHILVSFEGALDNAAIGAIHQHGNSLGHKWIGNLLPFKGNHAVFSRDGSQFYNLFDQGLWCVEFVFKSFSQNTNSTKEFPQ